MLTQPECSYLHIYNVLKS